MERLKKIISDTPKRDNYFVTDFNTFRERIVNYLQDLHEQVHECMNVINSINLEQISGKDGKDGKDGQDGIGVSNVLLNSDNSFTFVMTNGTIIVTDPVHIEGGGSGGSGTDGVGIDKVEVIQSSIESSGENIIRVILTNGDYYEFSIYNGAKGSDGIDGTNGTNGTNGVNGKSAYQLAVDNGYAGSLSDWLLSLKGEPGVDGKDGVNGVNGKDGIDGSDGSDGSDGKDGFSPYIDSTTGNWVDSTGDTGVHAQGPQGIQGIQGIQGPAGTTVYMDLTGKPTLQDYDTQTETTFNIVLIDESDYNNLSTKNPTTIYLIKDTTT